MTHRTPEQIRERYLNAIACPVSGAEDQTEWQNERWRRVGDYIRQLESQIIELEGLRPEGEDDNDYDEYEEPPVDLSRLLVSL